MFHLAYLSLPQIALTTYEDKGDHPAILTITKIYGCKQACLVQWREWWPLSCCSCPLFATCLLGSAHIQQVNSPEPLEIPIWKCIPAPLTFAHDKQPSLALPQCAGALYQILELSSASSSRQHAHPTLHIVSEALRRCADKKTLAALLERTSVGMQPEGIAGIFHGATSSQEAVFLSQRKGFVRVAIQAGVGARCSVIPPLIIKCCSVTLPRIARA